MISKIRCAALAACVAPFAVPAMASHLPGTDDATQISRMLLHDAELRSAQGAQALSSRVEKAFVCGDDDAMVPKGPFYATCREAAIDRTLATLDAPMVSDALGRSAVGGPAER